jgi:hypothetical protein
MIDLGETDYALRLSEDYKCIEQETRGKKLPKPVDRAIDENCFWELIETAQRSWLILQGRLVVATAMDDIQKLEQIPAGPLGAEGLLSIPQLAYENRSGKPLRLAKRKPAQVKGKQWEESDLQSRYPILYKRYGELAQNGTG